MLKSGWFILGHELQRFEEDLADYLGVSYAIGVGSGTEALHLALIACGIKPGDEVITVPNTAVPTVSAIDFAGGIPVFVDVDPETYLMSPESLDEYLRRNSKKAKAVIPVHLYGHPVEMDHLLAISEVYGLKVIEDCAQAHGTLYKGRKVGTLGDAGCFSFYPTKNLGAYGDAGIVVTGDKKIAERIRMLRNYGEESKYKNVIRGFNSRLDELQAAILRVKLGFIDEWNALRRRNAQLYNTLLKDTRLKLPVEKKEAVHVYHLYVVRTKYRDFLKRALSDKGIGTAIHYPTPVHLQGAYRNLGYKEGAFPIAEKCTREILSIPIFPQLSETVADEIISTMAE